jgi:hypothetical protein
MAKEKRGLVVSKIPKKPEKGYVAPSLPKKPVTNKKG